MPFISSARQTPLVPKHAALGAFVWYMSAGSKHVPENDQINSLASLQTDLCNKPAM